MGEIIISDLEVVYHVGVPAEERATAQRLLLTIKIKQDFTKAGLTDDLNDTVDYFAVTQSLLRFGQNRSWKLIEKLAADIRNEVRSKFGVDDVSVEVKKFIIPEAQFVAVKIAS